MGKFCPNPKCGEYITYSKNGICPRCKYNFEKYIELVPEDDVSMDFIKYKKQRRKKWILCISVNHQSM